MKGNIDCKRCMGTGKRPKFNRHGLPSRWVKCRELPKATEPCRCVYPGKCFCEKTPTQDE